MSKRRAATKVASYNEADESFTDFVKSAHARQQEQSSKYICRKSLGGKDALELEAFNSPGLNKPKSKRKIGGRSRLSNVQSNNGADEVVGSAAQKRSGAENVEEPKKKRSKADKQKQAAEAEKEEADKDEGKKGTNGSSKSRHEDQAEGHIGVPVEEVTMQPKTQAKPQKLAKSNKPASAGNARSLAASSRLSIVNSSDLQGLTQQRSAFGTDSSRPSDSERLSYEQWIAALREAEDQNLRYRQKIQEISKSHEEYVAVLEEENARLKSAGTNASKGDDSSVKQLQAEVDELQKANAQLAAAMDKLKIADEAGNKAHARDEKKIVKKLEDKCKELEKADKMNQELRAQCHELKQELEDARKELSDKTKALEKSERRAHELKAENDMNAHALEMTSTMTGLRLRSKDGNNAFTGIYTPTSSAAIEFSLAMVDNEWEYAPLSDKGALRVVPEFLREEIVFAPTMLRSFYKQMAHGGDQ